MLRRKKVKCTRLVVKCYFNPLIFEKNIALSDSVDSRKDPETILFAKRSGNLARQPNEKVLVVLSMGECNTILSAYTKYRHLG